LIAHSLHVRFTPSIDGSLKEHSTVKLRIPAILFLLLIAAGTAKQASAWNDRGHMTVAYIAYKKLKPAKRDRVDALLKMNPKYSEWEATINQQIPNASPRDKNLLIFMIAATWADQIKRDRAYISDGSDRGNRPDGSPDPTRNTGYDDMLMHKYWHFIDTPFSTDGTALPSIPTPNIQDRIALFRRVLASDSPDSLKSYDLSWLLHLIGDMHQPLHCSTRVSNADPLGDAGGNLVKLDCAKCELHFFWDDLLGTNSELKTVKNAARKIPKANAALPKKMDEKVWVEEGFEASKQYVYVPPIEASDGPFTLNEAYKEAAKRFAKERVAVAGARLANLLNKELK